MGRRAVGFYSKGRGRRRKIIPITARSRYAYRGIPPETPRPKPELEKTYPETHKHWMATDKQWGNIEHPINQPHLDVDSKRRHDIETGKFKRWVKRKGLRFVDSTYELYEQKIKAELETQKGGKRRGR